MYKIKDIANITGIQPQTLRVWEKRYGILIPNRTDSKIRYYTESDLIKLLNIALLLNNGWKISKIANLSQADIKSEITKIQLDGRENNVIVQLLIKALCTMDATLFLKVTESSIEREGLQYSFLNYFIPFFERTGIMWLADTINPAQEHMMSNLIRQKIIVEIDKLNVNTEPPVDYLLFCRENEYHEIGLLFYDYILKSKGYNVLYLGQNVPTEDIIRVSQLIEPKKGLVTSVLNRSDSDSVVNTMMRIQKETNCQIYIGGASFPEAQINRLEHFFKVDEIVSVG